VTSKRVCKPLPARNSRNPPAKTLATPCKTQQSSQKLTPKQKGDVVLPVKSRGDSVGMLGDGIHDCIALRVADVGISVESGMVMTKSCADLILTGKKLSTICDAIRIRCATNATKHFPSYWLGIEVRVSTGG
jgi:P-type E1-E2 ATPase